jgi:hypothetical protein
VLHHEAPSPLSEAREHYYQILASPRGIHTHRNSLTRAKLLVRCNERINTNSPSISFFHREAFSLLRSIPSTDLPFFTKGPSTRHQLSACHSEAFWTPSTPSVRKGFGHHEALLLYRGVGLVPPCPLVTLFIEAIRLFFLPFCPNALCFYSIVQIDDAVSPQRYDVVFSPACRRYQHELVSKH